MRSLIFLIVIPFMACDVYYDVMPEAGGDDDDVADDDVADDDVADDDATPGDDDDDTINDAPIPSISSPLDDVLFASSNHPVLWGNVQDAQDSPEQLYAEWHSSIDGIVAVPQPTHQGDVSVGAVQLSAGTHLLTLDAQDTQGLSGQDSVTIHICPGHANGILQTEDEGHVVVTIQSTNTSATDRLFVLEPVYAVITLDAEADVGQSVDLGPIESCGEFVFRVESSINQYTPYDSDSSQSFDFIQTASNHWTVRVEDWIDNDYNDVLFVVEGGI